jgi:lipoprotein-releasing system ATP-binding protein
MSEELAGGAILQVRDLRRSFVQGGVTIEVLRGIDFAVRRGEIVGLLGPSGSGKSTLLQAVGLLEGGFKGEIVIDGQQAAQLNDGERTRLRRDRLGFVYQFHHLLPDFSAAENVIIPQLIHGAEQGAARARAESLLDALGIGERLTHRPSKLSGGEQQRVAVARALANRPALVLADEPTGNLDTANTADIMAPLIDLNRSHGTTLLIVTHNHEVAAQARRVITFRDGKIKEDAAAAPHAPGAAPAETAPRR